MQPLSPPTSTSQATTAKAAAHTPSVATAAALPAALMKSTRTEMRPVKFHYADSFWCTYVVSVVSASIAELGEFSFDVQWWFN